MQSYLSFPQHAQADDEDNAAEDANLAGMAGALQRALQLRSNVIQQSGESHQVAASCGHSLASSPSHASLVPRPC